MNASPRRRAPLFGLLAANVISMVGNEITFIAIPWFVLQTTGSPALTGITAATAVVASVPAGLLGGVIVDRLGFKRTAFLSDVASAANVALIPLLHHTVGLPFPALLALVALGAILDMPGFTARESLLPDLVEWARIRPERANSMHAIAHRTAGLLGAPLAGLLIAFIGTSNVLWIDAASFVISAAVVAVSVPSGRRVERPVAKRAVGTGYFQELAEGVRFIRRDRVILWSTVVLALGGLLAEPLYSVVLPVYAREVFGSALDLGWMFAGLAGGSIVGGLIFAAIGHRLPRRATLITGFAGRAATFWVLVAIPPLWIVAGSIVVNATMLEPCNPLYRTMLQERVPAHLRGRVFGAIMAVSGMTRPIGMLAYGFLLSGAGLGTTLWVLATVNLIVPAAIVLVPAFHDMAAPREQEQETARREPRTGGARAATGSASR
jgi:MFS family permease